MYHAKALPWSKLVLLFVTSLCFCLPASGEPRWNGPQSGSPRIEQNAPSGNQRSQSTTLSPSVTLISPNLDEALQAGSTWTIRWSSSEVNSIRIEYIYFYSIGWREVVASVPAASGAYTWTVPESPSYTCRVRISDVEHPEISDQGDAFFTIMPSDARRFTPVWNGTPYLPMKITFDMVAVDWIPLRWGDEVGVFDGEICVGSVYYLDYAGSGQYAIVSRDNPSTPAVDGFVQGHAISYRLWRTGTSEEFREVATDYQYPTSATTFSSGDSALVGLAASGPGLPVQIASFQASATSEGAVRLEWVTLSESNNLGFEVERSSTAQSGYAVLPGCFVAGRGTSIAPQQYIYIDSSADAGRWHYRLCQIDLDGKRHQGPSVACDVTVLHVEDRVPQGLLLEQNYPNPFNPHTRISFIAPSSERVILRVYSLTGEAVATLFDGMAEAGRVYAVAFDGADLPSGAYFCSLTANASQVVRRMMLIR